MPLQFAHVCDLLERLEKNQQPRPGPGQRPDAQLIDEWFSLHRGVLSREDFDFSALLSTLLPEKRTDRVYALREPRLEKLIGRALCLGRSRIQHELGRWKLPGSGVDLADCVEGILRITPNAVSSVTVDEIDGLLHRLASACRFSSPAVRSSGANELARAFDLCETYKILSARDAKWLTRLILKNYQPVVLNPQVVYRACHPLLPTILKVQDDFATAGKVLHQLNRDRTVTSGPLSSEMLAQHLKPTLGVKVGRQQWFKGRSIKHCLNMIRGRVSCEEKIDGEYCQVHVDLSKGRESVQIFSKSGKDSTRDRMALHPCIRESLGLGQSDCPLKAGCILEGELVVYSDREARILDFHKIRKHVSRSGRFLGAEEDSQHYDWEHLMIVYYDVLLIDGESLLGVPHSERFRRLRQLVTCVEGRSALVERRIIDCNQRTAASDLRRAFAECITARKEGLVLKLEDDPFFDFGNSGRSCHPIKLKKGYIGSFGDVGDFAVIGARYDAATAKGYNIPGLRWTHFYIGCLANKGEIQRWGAKPKFIVTNVVELNAAQLEFFTTGVAPRSLPEPDSDSIEASIAPGIDNGKRPDVMFLEPPVFDIKCFSFDRTGNTGFWSPRFPMVTKIHCDRTYLDALTFEELQEMAKEEKEQPPPEDSQELLEWIATLEAMDSRGAGGLESQGTVASTTTAASTTTTITHTPSTTQSLGRTRLDGGVIPPLQASNRDDGSEASQRAFQSQAKNGQSTPPKSSPIDLTKDSHFEMTTGGLQENVARQKRPHPSPSQTTRSTKAQRCTKEQCHTVGARPPAREERPAGKGREPLSDIAATSPQRNYGVAGSQQHASAMLPVIQSPAATDAALGGLSARKDVRGKCTYCPDSCQLAEYSFLLSPCVSHIPWLTEDLLPSHGVTNYILDPAQLNEPPSSQAAGVSTNTDSMPPETGSAGGRQTKTARRKKVVKIVLVETRRKEATATFLQKIEAVGLRRRNGERDYVSVFDWRVLEDLTGEEAKCGRNRERRDARFDIRSSESIWRRHWVGLA